MSRYELYSHENQGEFSSTKIQIAAKYSGIELENKKASDLPLAIISKYPISKCSSFDLSFPILIEYDEDGDAHCIWGSFAITRYMGRLCKDETVRKRLLGSTLYQQAMVDQWIDFASNEMMVPTNAWLYPKYGFFETTKENEMISRNDVLSYIKKLNQHLESNTFFATERLSLADIVIFSTVLPLFIYALKTKEVKQFPNFIRWLKTCLVQREIKDIVGRPRFKAYEFIDRFGSTSTNSLGSRSVEKENEERRRELAIKLKEAKSNVAHRAVAQKSDVDKAIEVARAPIISKKLTKHDLNAKAIPSIYNPPSPVLDKRKRNHDTAVNNIHIVQQPV